MLLHYQTSPSPPSLSFIPPSSSSSRLLLGFRSPTIHVKEDEKKLSCLRIRCSSISKVHNYGTVDFERRPSLKWSSLYRRIATMENQGFRSGDVLDRWEKDERRLSKWELCRVAKELRKFRRYRLALEIYEWMTARGDRFTFTASDMAIQLDLIAKVYGIPLAEEHFSKLPDTLKDKRTYGSLLNVYGQAKMKSKAEEVVEKMRNNGYATDALPFNVMMTLYMNVGEHDNVIRIIDEMKEKNIMFDIYSYNIWITNCAAMQDVEGMERVLSLMTADSNINANWTTYTTLSTMYIRLGNFEKAQSCLKEAEARMTGRDRIPFNYLIGLYGSIGKREEVYRIWNWYKATFPAILNLGYQSMLSSLIRLGDADGTEKIYDEWMCNTSNYDPKICNILMGWYARQGFVSKAKHALDQLVAKGGKPKPTTWEILAEGYIKESQIPEALSCLKKASSNEGVNNWKPKPTNVANLLALCKQQNDIGSTVMVLDILRSRGCYDKEEYKSLIST